MLNVKNSCEKPSKCALVVLKLVMKQRVLSWRDVLQYTKFLLNLKMCHPRCKRSIQGIYCVYIYMYIQQ